MRKFIFFIEIHDIFGDYLRNSFKLYSLKLGKESTYLYELVNEDFKEQVQSYLKKKFPDLEIENFYYLTFIYGNFFAFFIIKFRSLSNSEFDFKKRINDIFIPLMDKRLEVIRYSRLFLNVFQNDELFEIIENFLKSNIDFKKFKTLLNNNLYNSYIGGELCEKRLFLVEFPVLFMLNYEYLKNGIDKIVNNYFDNNVNGLIEKLKFFKGKGSNCSIQTITNIKEIEDDHDLLILIVKKVKSHLHNEIGRLYSLLLELDLKDYEKWMIYIADHLDLFNIEQLKFLRKYFRLFQENAFENGSNFLLNDLEQKFLNYYKINQTTVPKMEDYEQLSYLDYLFEDFPRNYLFIDNSIKEYFNLEKKIEFVLNSIQNHLYLVKAKKKEREKNKSFIENIFEYDFAFSFAGEDRVIVEKIYDSLTKRGLKIFYDKSYEWYLAGKDLDKLFKEIYGKKSKYVVVFVSKNYSEKKWTDFESQIAEKVAESKKEEYIIPIRLDDTIVYGIKSTIGYLDYRNLGTRRVSDNLEKKLKDFNKSL